MVAKILTPALAVLSLALPAQATEVDHAPSVPEWIPIVISILLVAILASASFKPSKRGHQD